MKTKFNFIDDDFSYHNLLVDITNVVISVYFTYFIKSRTKSMFLLLHLCNCSMLQSYWLIGRLIMITNKKFGSIQEANTKWNSSTFCGIVPLFVEQFHNLWNCVLKIWNSSPKSAESRSQ